MNKERKSEYFHLRMTPTLKQRLMERSLELGKEPSVYLTALIERDLSEHDLTEAEKPRMKQFAQEIAAEFFANMEPRIDSLEKSVSEKQEHNSSLLFWIYRMLLFSFYNLGLRIKLSGNIKPDDLKQIDDESTKLVNTSFDRFLDFARVKNAKAIFDYLRKPM